MATDSPKFLFAGGGTGGHLFPALAIAEALRKKSPSAEFLFVGTRNRIESRVVPEFGFPFRTVWISGFQRRRILSNILIPLKVGVSLIQSFFLIKQFKPDVVVGTGSYVCAPVLFMASVLGIPTVLHESNSYPGITTKLLARRMTKVFTAFESVARWLPERTTLERVGTPTRLSLGTISREEGCSAFGLDSSRKVVLVTGGSLGAKSINTAVHVSLEKLLALEVQLIWQTGSADFERIRQSIGKQQVGWVGPFIKNMAEAYAAADLIIARSGATTVAELCVVGKPAVLVPYPHAAEDHQTHNARALEDAGAAVMISDLELPTRLMNIVTALLREEKRRQQMVDAFRSMGQQDAGRTVAGKILDLIR